MLATKHSSFFGFRSGLAQNNTFKLLRETRMFFVFKVLISAFVIALAAWLSGRFPRAAGFLVALPLSTMLVLPLAYLEHQDPEKITALAKSILIALPGIVIFLLPFIFGSRWGLPFWVSYMVAVLWLIPAFFLHRFLFGILP
jgi:hypothetical protein